MPISPISSQINQFTQSASASTSSASNSSSVSAAPVTSSNPTVLTQQEKTVQNQIAQLQRNHGSAQNIQSLNQELQTIQKQLQKASFTATQSENQQVAIPKSTNLDVEA
jgi:N-acetylmuramoyl-L-alanine amidase CwlA